MLQVRIPGSAEEEKFVQIKTNKKWTKLLKLLLLIIWANFLPEVLCLLYFTINAVSNSIPWNFIITFAHGWHGRDVPLVSQHSVSATMGLGYNCGPRHPLPMEWSFHLPSLPTSSCCLSSVFGFIFKHNWETRRCRTDRYSYDTETAETWKVEMIRGF